MTDAEWVKTKECKLYSLLSTKTTSNFELVVVLNDDKVLLKLYYMNSYAPTISQDIIQIDLQCLKNVSSA